MKIPTLRFHIVVLLFVAVAAHALEAVTVKNYITFGRERNDATPRSVGRVAAYPGGIAIIDADNERILLRNDNGSFVSIPIEATAIAFGHDVLFAAEEERIRRFGLDGKELPMLVDDSVIGFSSITGLAVDAAGNVYASDRGADLVFVISPDGMPLTTIGAGAKAPAALSNPADVAVDRSGHVFIADPGNTRVAIYSVGGAYIGHLTPIEEPVAVTVDADGVIYVADAQENRILRYSFPAAPQGAFGTKGRDRGQFREIADLKMGFDGVLRVADASNRSLHELSWPSTSLPLQSETFVLSARWRGVNPMKARPLGVDAAGRLAVAVDDEELVLLDRSLNVAARLAKKLKNPVAAVTDAKGRLYVAEKDAGEIKVFDTSLSELFSFGRGSRVIFFRGGPGKLVAPRGLAVSSTGILAIVDRDKVELFGPDGTYMTSVGVIGDEPGQYEEPVGAAFDREGNIYVADEENGRLLKYDQSGRWTGMMVENVEPAALASDAAGRIYLLDRARPCVRIYSQDLAPLLEIGADGLVKGGLKNSTAMVVHGDRLFLSRRDGLAEILLDLPPLPPSGLALEPGMRRIAAHWDASAGFAEEYRVLIDGALLARTPNTSCEAVGLDDDREYEISIRGVNRFGRFGIDGVSGTARTRQLTLPVPSEPTVAASADGRNVLLSWSCDSFPFVSGYVIEAGDGIKFVELTRSAATTSAFPMGAARRYRVRALAGDKVGQPSPEAVHFTAEGTDALLLGQNSLAFERFTRAVVAEPRNGAAWRGLGESGEKLERYKEAMEAYEKARALAPSDTRALLGLARVALLRGDSASARLAVAMLSPDPTDAEYSYVAGMTALLDEAYETAVAHLSRAVAVSPISRHRDALARAEELRRNFGENRPRLEIASFLIEPIFPVLYKAYMARPIAEMVVANSGRQVLERVRVSAFIRGAMDFPSDTVIRRLEPGETALVPIRVELANSVLDVTEDETKQVELRLTYYRSGDPVEVRRTGEVRLHARTAMSWRNPAAAAAFVTHRAPVVAEFARNVAAMASDRPDAANMPVRLAQIVRRALIAYGMRYQTDPVSPFARVSEEADAVDHVQLPEETLRNRSGDCDDLVVLYSALLENLGVSTMIADLPGHLVLFINTELPAEAASLIALPERHIVLDGIVWLPIETTLLEGDFDRCVEAGAVAAMDHLVKYVFVSSAWREYPPVTTIPTAWRAQVPERSEVLAGFDRDDRATQLRAASELARRSGDESSADTGSFNRLGVLYARFGLLDEAESWLKRDGVSAASLNNLGNVMMLRGRAAEAQEYYRRAMEISSDPGIGANLEKATAL